MQGSTKKAVWLTDETFAKTDSRYWTETDRLCKELVKFIGNPSIEHEVLTPQFCLVRLVEKLEKEKPSVIINLMEFPLVEIELKKIFSNIPIIKDFRISRIYHLAPGIKTYGYILNKSPIEIAEIARGFDLAHPLIIDNVGMSGRTAMRVAKAWGIDTRNSLFAFLVINTGQRFNHPGANQIITEHGGKTLAGYQLCTPYDDAWHLADLHPPKIEENLQIFFEIQKIIAQSSKSDTPELRLLFKEQKIQDAIMCSGKFTKEKIEKLWQKDQFFHQVASDRIKPGDYVINPPLWILGHFLPHIDREKIKKNWREIIEILQNLNGKNGEIK